MGCDIHFYLERKVMTKESHKSLAAFKTAFFSSRDDMLIDIASGDMLECISYQSKEWLPVKYSNWLPLPEEELADISEDYYQNIANGIFMETDEYFKTPLHEIVDMSDMVSERVIRGFFEDWITFHKLKREKTINGTVVTTIKDTIPMLTLNDDAYEVWEHAKNYADEMLVDRPSPMLSRFMQRRDYECFALFSNDAVSSRLETDIRELPCMIKGIPEDIHPVYEFDGGGVHSYSYCYLDELLETDWEAEAAPQRTHRSLMGDECIAELTALADGIGGAAPLSDFRLVVSFDS